MLTKSIVSTVNRKLITSLAITVSLAPLTALTSSVLRLSVWHRRLPRAAGCLALTFHTNVHHIRRTPYITPKARWRRQVNLHRSWSSCDCQACASSQRLRLAPLAAGCNSMPRDLLPMRGEWLSGNCIPAGIHPLRQLQQTQYLLLPGAN